MLVTVRPCPSAHSRRVPGPVRRAGSAAVSRRALPRTRPGRQHPVVRRLHPVDWSGPRSEAVTRAWASYSRIGTVRSRPRSPTGVWASCATCGLDESALISSHGLSTCSWPVSSAALVGAVLRERDRSANRRGRWTRRFRTERRSPSHPSTAPQRWIRQDNAAAGEFADPWADPDTPVAHAACPGRSELKPHSWPLPPQR